MSLELKQTSTYKEEDWWDWSIWLDGTDEELDRVERVVYKLHPTFHNPKRIVTDRSNNFRLDESGWGEFPIVVKINTKDGETIEKKHWLKLDPPASQEVAGSGFRSEKNENPMVFVSGGVSDVKFTRALIEGFKDEGIEVLTVNDVEAGLPWEASLNSILHRADHAVVVISGESSAWLTGEINAMQSHKVPITPILIGSQPKLPGALSHVQGIRIKDASEATYAARNLAGELKKTII